jgi:hypothetical protein
MEDYNLYRERERERDRERDSLLSPLLVPNFLCLQLIFFCCRFIHVLIAGLTTAT